MLAAVKHTHYTGDVVERLEKIIKEAEKMLQEVAIMDYSKVA